MYIEDLILTTALFVNSINKWDKTIFISLNDQLNRGLGLTEKQKNLALKLLSQNSAKVSSYLNKDISLFLINPTYKMSSRQLSYDKLISICTHKDFEQAIRVEFPYNNEIIAKIKQNKYRSNNIMWDQDEKSWFFELTEENLLFAIELHNQFSFILDEKIQKYKIQIEKIINNVENYVPMISYVENKFIYVNSSGNLPKNNETNPLAALFEARKKGIFTWDESVLQLIENLKINSLTFNFLKSDQHKFFVDHETYAINDLKDIISHLTPVLLVIPGGSELSKLTIAFNFFKDIGLKNENISVMFRLPNDTDNSFNEFIKNNGLNNSINENTKVVAISTKIPKPVIKSKIKFHCILNLGFNSVHYTIRDFIETHENLIFYHNKSQQQELNFGNM